MKNDIEKSLKRWLKKKITITLGMVVSFLISGNLGYAEININEEEIRNEVKVDKFWTEATIDKIINNGIIIGGIKANSHWREAIIGEINNQGIINSGINLDSTLSFTKLGTLNNQGIINGVSLNSSLYAKINSIKNEGIINQISLYSNTGEVRVNNGNGIDNQGIINEINLNSSLEIEMNLLNNQGIINSDEKSGISLISRLSNINIENILNNGVVKGKENGITLDSSLSSNINSIINNGLILGKEGNGISLKTNFPLTESTKIILENNGVIYGKGEAIAAKDKHQQNKGLIINGEKVEIGEGGITTDDKLVINTSFENNELAKEKSISSNELSSKTEEKFRTDNGYKNLILNGYGTTIRLEGELVLTDTIINGGINEAPTIMGSEVIDNLTLSGKTILNGDIDLKEGDDSLVLDSTVQINGNLLGGEGADTLNFTTSENSEKNNINIYKEINSFENINVESGANVTLYETAKVVGTNEIKVDAGGQINLRIDSSKKDSDGRYSGHALYNDTNQKLYLIGDLSKIDESEYDEEEKYEIVEGETEKYSKIGILNIITNGLGKENTIKLGNVEIDNSLWVKTNSILNKAEKQLSGEGTNIIIKAEKDLFTILNPNRNLEVGYKYNIDNETRITGIENIEINKNIIADKYNNAGIIDSAIEEQNLILLDIDSSLNKNRDNGMIYSSGLAKLSVQRIENTGSIIGNFSSDSNNEDSGNGIILKLDDSSDLLSYESERNLSLEEGIINIGFISGKIENKATTGKNINSGNGIGIFTENNNHLINLNIADEEETVGIYNAGYITTDTQGVGETISEYSGNGIVIAVKEKEKTGNINIGNLSNTGVVITNHNSNISSLDSIGSNNGILVHDSSKGILTLDSIVNDGLIVVNRNINPDSLSELGEYLTHTSYNGIALEVTSEEENNILHFENIINDGSIIVSGKSSVEVEGHETLNGIYLGVKGKVEGAINNNGKIASGWANAAEGSTNYGNGILVNGHDENTTGDLTIINRGLTIGKQNAVEVSEESDITLTYNNYGLLVGQNLVKGRDFEDERAVDYGYGIKIDEDATVTEVIGKAGEKKINENYSVLNTKLTEDGKDAYQIFGVNESGKSNLVINGVGEASGTVTVAENKHFRLGNSIVNAYKTALTLKDNSEFTGFNIVLNGGGFNGSGNETATVKGNKNAILNLAGDVRINGAIDLDSNDKTDDFDRIVFGTDAQLNGQAIRTEVGIYDEVKGADSISINSNTNLTLYGTSNILGTSEIKIDKGGKLSLRVDTTKTKEMNGNSYYIGHALFNNGENLVIKGEEVTDASNNIPEVDEEIFDNIMADIENGGNLTDATGSKNDFAEENYKDVGVIDIMTNGLGKDSLIALGDVDIETSDALWVKTNSILTNAEIITEEDLLNKKAETTLANENENPGTIIRVSTEKDIYDVSNKVSKDNKRYEKLNGIYKGIYSSSDENFKELNNIVINYNFGSPDKVDYNNLSVDEQQLTTLLGYLGSVYTETPYSFSSEATRKSMGLFHDTVRDNDFKAKDKEWLVYGGLLHQSGDQEQIYYGRNYHGFDIGSIETDVDMKLTGAYGQFEYGNSDTLSTGLLIGGSKSDIDVAASKLDGTAAYIGAYAKKDIKDFRVITGIGYQYSEYNATRNTINQSYSQDYKDRGVNLYLDGKYSHNLGNNFYLEPKVGLSYTYITQEGITENQNQTLALDVDSKEFNILEGTVGLDVKKVIPTENGKHSISAGVTYRSILSGDEADYLTANYGGSDFEILIPHKNKNQVSIGTKYEVELENGMFYNVKGNYFMNVDSKENTNKNADKGEWRVGIGFGYRFSSVKDLNPVVMLRDFSIKSNSYFDFDKAELKLEGKAVVKKISTELNKVGTEGTLKMEGHTDSTGKKEYNQKLSEERAKSVENEFKKNITNEKIQYDTKGYGEDNPIADNTTEEGRAKNRRVDIKFEGKEEQ